MPKEQRQSRRFASRLGSHGWRRSRDPVSAIVMDTPIEKAPTPEMSTHEAKQIHCTHIVYDVKEILLCSRCGYWRQLKIEHIRLACPGQSQNNSYRTGRNRLMRGQRPRPYSDWPGGTTGNSRSAVAMMHMHTTVYAGGEGEPSSSNGGSQSSGPARKTRVTKQGQMTAS